MSHPEIKNIATHIMAKLRSRSTGVRPEDAATSEALTTGGAVPAGNRDAAVSKRAYQLWLERGCPEGSPEQDWFQAESELRKPEQVAARGGADGA